MRRELLSLIIIASVAFIYAAGCGGGTLTGYPFDDGTTTVGVTEPEETPSGDEAVAGEVGPQGEAGEDGRDGANTAIPAGVWLDGVNRIEFFSSAEGLVMQAADTTAAGILAGAFNGAGTGNKALIGLNQYNDMRASDITDISVTARRDRGSSFFYFNMQVDCDGDGAFNAANDGIVVVDSDTVADFALATGVMTTIDLDPADAVFKMVGGPKAGCGNLPSHLGGAVGSPLTDLPATARLWNGSTGDNGMPRDTELAAVLFVMGDSANQQARTMTVESIILNGDEYSFK